MSARGDRSGLWQDLTAFSETFTCYSAAVATSVAYAEPDWGRRVNPGLWLSVGEQPDGLFGFSHLRPGLRAELGLTRRGADGTADAVAGVLEELRVSGRVIVAGDGFHLPWHVAFQRRHVPHWFVLADSGGGTAVIDPFACRNELGVQTATHEPLAEAALGPLLPALPGDDPILRLRESLALGDQAPPGEHRYQWFASGVVEDCTAPAGARGPHAVERLARHFRDHGQSLEAYAQADDIWSIARHRAFLVRFADGLSRGGANAALADWVTEHGALLAKRWAHISPLMMQATLALGAGRTASASVPDALDQLASLERAAAPALEERSLAV